MDQEQLEQEYAYYITQKIVKKLFDEGLISKEEYDEITRINQGKYLPKLREIMPL